MSAPTLSVDGKKSFVMEFKDMPSTGVGQELLYIILDRGDIEAQVEKWPTELNDTTVEAETSRSLGSRSSMSVSALQATISRAHDRIIVLKEGHDTFHRSVRDFNTSLHSMKSTSNSLNG